jgi:sulfite reductase (NADPH) hemoprotein beta-component
MSKQKIERLHDLTQPLSSLHDNEKLKANSHYLRGTISQGLETTTTASLCHDDTLLTKFHGIYQQDDRDIRQQRAKRKLEPDYQFMVRLRIPGGLLRVNQWQKIHFLSQRYASSGIRITTRQTVQLHGVRKWHLRTLLSELRSVDLDTIAACGDDSRGIVCGAAPQAPAIERRIQQLAIATSARLIPKTAAYAETWYQETLSANANGEEPVYGELYLPRKFKVGYVIPPLNDIDVFGQDVGFIAVIEENQLQGFNVCVGGGMGQLDNRDDSYPRLASEIGFVDADDAPFLSEVIMGIQRDYGDRQDRHQARFKYTIDRIGIDVFKDLLEKRFGKKLTVTRSYHFQHNGDQLGWIKSANGDWQLTLYIDSGRVRDGLQDQIAAFLQDFHGRLRLTTNQNLQLLDIEDFEKQDIERRLVDLGLSHRAQPELQHAHSMSCVALPTCGLAMAEAERYLPYFLEQLEQLKKQNGITNIPINLRITGCPNGCARPYLGEIALTGRAPGLYNLYLGGSHRGDRLAGLHDKNMNEQAILHRLDQLFHLFAKERLPNEFFGDFLHRNQLVDPSAHQHNLSDIYQEL